MRPKNISNIWRNDKNSHRIQKQIRDKNFLYNMKNRLHFPFKFAIIQKQSEFASVAQQVEQLIRNQQVAGSNPATSSKLLKLTKASQSGAFCLLFAICRFSPFALCALKIINEQLSLSLRAPCDGDAPVLMQTDTFRPRVPAGYFSGSLQNRRFCGVNNRSPCPNPANSKKE